MNSKSKGNIGEALALAEFSKYNIPVAVPFGDNARYDLIADFNNKLNRIQVKYCNQITENDSVLCPCASSTNHTTNKGYSTYENDIDYFVFYIVSWNKLLLVPIEKIGTNKSITFRLTPAKTGQTANVNYADDFLFEKYFNIPDTNDI